MRGLAWRNTHYRWGVVGAQAGDASGHCERREAISSVRTIHEIASLAMTDHEIASLAMTEGWR